MAARLLLRTGHVEVASAIGVKAVALVEYLVSSGELAHSARAQQALAASAASFLRQLGLEHFERSYQLYTTAIHNVPEEISGSTYTSAADVALQLGKRCARLGLPLAVTNFLL